MVYIDNEYKCHTTNPDGVYREIEKPLFVGMCDTWIEGMIYIPEGESYTIDGVVYRGEMHSPWKPYDELYDAQRDYERQLIITYKKALQTMGVVL